MSIDNITMLINSVRGASDNNAAISSSDRPVPSDSTRPTVSVSKNSPDINDGVIDEFVGLINDPSFFNNAKDKEHFLRNETAIDFASVLLLKDDFINFAEDICNIMLGVGNGQLSIPAKLAGRGLEKQLPKLQKATNSYQINSARLYKAEILFKKAIKENNPALRKEALELCVKVLNDAKSEPYQKADAALKIADELLKDKACSEAVKFISDKITGAAAGTISDAAISAELKSLGINATLLSKVTSMAGKKDSKYYLQMAKLAKAQALSSQNNKTAAASLCLEVLKDSPDTNAVKSKALILYGNILAENKQTAPSALEIFAALQQGNNALEVKDASGQKVAAVKVMPVSPNDKFNYYSVLLGLNKAALATNPGDATVKSKAATAFDMIRTDCANDPSLAYIYDAATLELADIYASTAGKHGDAIALYNKILVSDTPFIAKRAALGGAILALEDKDIQAKNINDVLSYVDEVISKAASDPDISKYFVDRAVLAKAAYQLRTKNPAAALAALTPEFINGIDQSEKYLIASALLLRGNANMATKDFESAVIDFANAQVVASMMPAGAAKTQAEVRANYGLTNAVSADNSTMASKLNNADAIITIGDKQITVKSRQSNKAAYESAKAGGLMESDSYIESDMAVGGLDLAAASWDHKKSSDAARSGELVNGYKTVIDNTETDEMTKNRARNGLAMAFQKMGRPEEAKKVLNHAAAAVPGESITEADMSGMLNNYGFIAIGDSDFNLSCEYFRRAAEYDKDSPNSLVYMARAAFLTEKFSKDVFTAIYDRALDKTWALAKRTGDRPSIEQLSSAALSEDKTALNALASTPEGRFMVLTALEAQAKIYYAKGNSLKAAQCFEQAKDLFETWKGAGLELPSDYLFEYQLHYDLATVYLSLNRLYDAYNEYKLISDMPGVPNWFVKDQLLVLNPAQITVSASDNGDMNLAYRRNLENGGFGVKVTEDGAIADIYLLAGQDKSHTIKAHFGAFEHGRIDAGMGYSKDFGRVRASAGIDYNRDTQGNDVTGINGALEFNVSRHLKLGIDGKYEWHNEDGADFGTYEIGASANYSRRIAKDTTFNASARVAYGTQRDYSVGGGKATHWIDLITTPQEGQSDWIWDTDTACYTTNAGSADKYRQRYWIKYRGYDLQGNEVTAWHIATAIEPDVTTAMVPTPTYGNVKTETVDVPLSDLYIEGFAHREGNSVVFNDARNAIFTEPGAKPTSQEINAIDVNTLTGDDTKPRVQIHKESYTTRTTMNEFVSTTTITVKGQDRQTPEDAYPTESDPWGPEEELYTIKVVSTATSKQVTITYADGTSKVLYMGGSIKRMNQTIKVELENYYKASVYAGITKKFHGGALPDGTEITLSASATAKYIPGEKRYAGNLKYTPAKEQLDLSMGPRIEARVPVGSNGFFTAGAGYIFNGTKMNVQDKHGNVSKEWVYDKWGFEGHIDYTRNLSGNDIENGTYLTGSVSTGGAYMGIQKGDFNAGIGTEGPQVGFNLSLGKAVSELPVGISAAGPSIGGIPVAATVNPVALGVGSLAKAIDDSKALKSIRSEKERLEKEIDKAQASGDKETAAYLRFIYDNLFMAEGSHEANWLKDSTRIPVLNLLTMLGGNRVRKNAGSIIEETRQITGHFDSLNASGAFASGLTDASRDAIKQYLGNDTDYHNEKQGSIAKAADAQDKAVKGVFSPFRAVGKALHLTGNKPGEGCVNASSFKAASNSVEARKQIVAELETEGYIEAGTGRVTGKAMELNDASALELSDTLKDKQQIVFGILKASAQPVEGNITEAVDVPQTDDQLIAALNKKVREDAMYLVYRNISEKGSNPETRKEVAEALVSLPDNVRVEIEAFIDNLPVDIKLRADKTVKVVVEQEGKKDAKVKVTPEIYTKSAIKGESLSGKLEIEDAAIAEFKNNKPSVVDAFKSLKDALAIASILHDENNNADLDRDKDKVNDAVYKAAITLFMLAAKDDDDAIIIGRAMKDGIKAGEINIEKLNDKEKAIIINGIVNKEEIEALGNDSDLIWNKLVTAGYIFENGAVSNAFKSVNTPQDLKLDLDAATKSAIFNILKSTSGLNDNIADFTLNRRPGATKFFGGQKDAIKVAQNELKVKDRMFTVEEFVNLSIKGELDKEIQARVNGKDLEASVKKGEDLPISERPVSAEVRPGSPAVEPREQKEEKPVERTGINKHPRLRKYTDAQLARMSTNQKLEIIRGH